LGIQHHNLRIIANSFEDPSSLGNDDNLVDDDNHEELRFNTDEVLNTDPNEVVQYQTVSDGGGRKTRNKDTAGGSSSISR